MLGHNSVMNQQPTQGGRRNTPGHFMLLKLEIRGCLMGHLSLPFDMVYSLVTHCFAFRSILHYLAAESEVVPVQS